ncbi:hypothetical protein MMC52_00009875 [Klebsiella quasipneumoniae]|uniref:hypothetical protein n=1 Tax=Klebsiella quasipneumoniae TaxID=1463165 RepID=UPI003EC99948
MNRAATLTLNAPLLMLVAALALSTPFFAGAAPVLTTPSSKPRRMKKAMLQPQSKRQAIVNLRIIKKRRPIPHNCKKESSASRRRLSKKIKLFSN